MMRGTANMNEPTKQIHGYVPDWLLEAAGQRELDILSQKDWANWSVDPNGDDDDVNDPDMLWIGRGKGHPSFAISISRKQIVG